MLQTTPSINYYYIVVEKLSPNSKTVYISHRAPEDRAGLIRQIRSGFSSSRERGSFLGQQQRAAMSEAQHPTPKKLDK